MSSVCFRLLPIDVAWDNIYLFCSCRVIALAFSFGKMAPVAAIMDGIYSWFSAIDNSLLYASEHSPADKIEERINFFLRHARLYLAESDDECYNKSAATNTFDIFCGGGVSISSL